MTRNTFDTDATTPDNVRSHQLCCPSTEAMITKLSIFMTEHPDASFYHDVADRLSAVRSEVAFSCGGDENYLIAARVKRGEHTMDCSLIVSDEALEFARGAMWAAFFFEGFDAEIEHSDSFEASEMTLKEQAKATHKLLRPVKRHKK